MNKASPHNPTVVVIAGPTASGKTALAIWLAEKLGTQILSADSRQCYQELNIGVARPSPEELRQVHHYFIASHGIQETVNAGSYAAYGLKVLDELFERFGIVLVVGGTGLYLKALIEGVDDMPPIPMSIRQGVTEQYNKNGLPWLQQEIRLQDPTFWAQAEQANPQRLMRGLEFKLATGTSILEFRKNEPQQRNFKVIKIGLELPRAILYERINLRVDQMLAAGLEKEVQGLLPFRDLNALQTVGYKELFDYFDLKTGRAKAIESIKQNTRHYAKRQMTWFKKDENFQWFDPSDKENILSCIKSAVNGDHSL